jgi:hypothetical protein
MGALDAMAAKFNESKPLGQRRPFDQFGTYLQKLQAVRKADSFQHGGEYCAIEKRVVRMIAGPGNNELTGQPLPTNHVGQEIVDMINGHGAQAKVYGSKCRTFISTILGSTFEETTYDDYLAACDPSQPLAGMLLEIDNSPFMVEVKKDGPKKGQREARPAKRYVRGYTPKEIPGILTKEEIAQFYPGGELDRLIAAQIAAENGAPEQPTGGVKA